MGEVHKAWDRRLRRWVALKSVHPHRPLTPELRAQLAREARAAAALNHPAVARLELREGHITDARHHLEEVLEIAPLNIGALALLGELELIHGPPEHAEELYLQVVLLAPEPRYQSNLGVAQLIAGRYGQAAARFERLLGRRPRHSSDLLNLADCYYLMGDINTARPLYREAVHTFEGFGDNITPEQLGIMAQAQLGAGDPTSAVATIQEALRRAPRSPDVNFYAALIFAAVGDTSSALACVQSAVELGVNPHWFRLAWFDGLRKNARFVDLTRSDRDKAMSNATP